ncbi:MAG: hypothetical protein LH473_04225, partial [Chitinophagales bacterium]|nr:hypothetical protein [Chitinophagales bacterium]
MFTAIATAVDLLLLVGSLFSVQFPPDDKVVKFDEAVKAFSDFRDSKQKLSKEFTPAERLIEMCGNGKLLVASPVNVTYTNLGKTINTIYEEYNPF